MIKKRKIFFTIASGGHETDKHYYETIKTKRSVEEISNFLSRTESLNLKTYTHDRPYAVWGAVPGSGNIRTWETMDQGDYVLVYRSGKIIAAAEVAAKIRNPNLATFFWDKDINGKTWELTYFLTNLIEVNVNQTSLNKYLGYKENYSPRGFMSIDQDKTDKLLMNYGDLLSLLTKLQKGEKLEHIEVGKEILQEYVDDQIKTAPTEHTEMQWHLISIGNKTKLDVWIPPADQGREYANNKFRDHILSDFRESIDVPSYIKNIDTVWKLGLSIKAAFEIENSTSIYSGILRLSDLKALAPNSNYPLFIVANRDKKSRVFDQLRRPTFANDYLQLDKQVRYLSYDKVRELDNQDCPQFFDVNFIVSAGELVS
jgi:hypothetical protein